MDANIYRSPEPPDVSSTPFLDVLEAQKSEATWPIEPPAGTRVADTLAWYAGQYRLAVTRIAELERNV